MQEKATEIRCRFNDVPTLITKANPETQIYFADKSELAITGDFPTLSELNATFGSATAQQWLQPHIADLVIYAGAKNIDKYQQGQLARIIVAEFYWLKMSELMLFFHRFKTGRYGHFYGEVDPMLITIALRDFINERNELLSSIEQEQRKRKEEEEKKNAISYEEFLKLQEDGTK